MNRTIKETLTKLTLETGGDWVTPLPFLLFKIRNTPYRLGMTPFEILFGRPPLILPNLRADLLAEQKDKNFLSSLQALFQVQEALRQNLQAVYSKPPPEPHNFQPGDLVLIKRHQKETLEPRWKGPHIVILATPTAIKVDRISA